MAQAKFVLIVEDEDEIRSMIVDALKAATEGQDYHFVEAKDGREAIHYTGRQEFHCILTDLAMPRTCGDELIRMLLMDAMNANTPTIVVSGNLTEDFLKSFKNVRTVAKPFIPNELAQMVIREVKLGRMDERVPVHLLNPVLDSLQKIMSEDMSLGADFCKLKAPAVRKSGDRVEGDLYATFTLTTGLTQARIGISFDREWLAWVKQEYFSTRRDQWSAMTTELTARQMALAIVDRAQSSLKAFFGSAPRIAELTIVHLDDNGQAIEAARSGGVCVALDTDQGQVRATALAPTRAKRIAA